MAELRAGGLAIIVNSLLSENVGKAVIIKSYLGVIRGYVKLVDMPAWEVESASCETMKGLLPGGQIISTKNLSVPADWLMPIDGDDFSHEREHEKELINGQQG